MTAEVILFPGQTTLELPAKQVLETAVDNVKECMIVGCDDDGDLYFAATTSDKPKMLYWMERAKQILLED